MSELYLSSGARVPLMAGPGRKFKGTRLPGATFQQAEQERYGVTIHTYTGTLFHLVLREFDCAKSQNFILRESSPWLRLETVITGELRLSAQRMKEIHLHPGEYWLRDMPACQLSFRSGGHCLCLSFFLSPELLRQAPLGHTIVSAGPRLMSRPMRESVNRMLTNPFAQQLRDACYDYSIRELLFYHISAPAELPPGELTQEEISLMYAVDAIISANLNVHHTISELAQQVGTNDKVIKTHFVKVFGMSTFERLIFLKMQTAQYLLETTDLQVQEVGEKSGYETPTGFINAFRDHFQVSPQVWREQSRGLPPAQEENPAEGMSA